MSSAHSASTAPTVSTSLTIIFGKGPRKIILSSPVSGGAAADAADSVSTGHVLARIRR